VNDGLDVMLIGSKVVQDGDRWNKMEEMSDKTWWDSVKKKTKSVGHLENLCGSGTNRNG